MSAYAKSYHYYNLNGINKMQNTLFGSCCVFPSLGVHLPLQAHQILHYNLDTKRCIFSY
jgi:hypothetical protein